MLFSEKLNKKGYIIYVGGALLATTALTIIMLTMPTMNRVVSFTIFAAIYLIGFFIAKKHTVKKND